MSKRFSILGLKGVLAKFLPALLLAVGVFSGTASAQCAGTVRLKPPDDWTEAYFGTRNCTAALAGHATTKDAEGYFTFDLSTIGHQENGAGNFSILSSVTQGSISMISLLNWVMPVGSGEAPQNALTNNAVFPCPGAGNTLYVASDPLNPGKTYRGSVPPSAKYFFVLVPDDKEWQSDVMMVSASGGAGVQMSPAPGMCGWFQMVYEESLVPEEVIIYRKNKPEDQIGQNGLWGEEADPIPLPLKTILEAFGTDRLYFIPDDTQWPDGEEAAQGLFIMDPGVDGICTFNLAAVIYDSDENVNNLFSSDPNTAGYGACTGVRHGIVKEDLGPDNKPQFNAGNANATTCAGSEAEFNTLFNYTAGKNEVQCYNMPFRHYGSDPRWGFDSDSTHYNLNGDELESGGYTGGFYPLEHSTADTRVASLSPQACDACRTKRKAEAPVPYSYSGDFDKYCNTPGWFGGNDCDRLTGTGANSFYNGDNPAVWDWGTRQDWTGVTRNQQYCFESHATFTYSEDQEFTFRGDDDIWVFINKKIAVDNGGAHLAAPGHVVLKNLNTTYGEGFLVPGNDYQLDIFFCDRRTTMTNVIIKTNMFIKQSSGLSANGTLDKATGVVDYSICYQETGDGSCASLAGVGGGSGSSSEPQEWCGADIASKGKLKYSITTRAGVLVDTLVAPSSSVQHGGIDLSNAFAPKVNTEKITGLPPGSYRLVIDFCDANGTCNEKARTYISFRVKGNLDVMTQNSTYTVNAGDPLSAFYPSGTTWTFVGEGLAGTRVPVYVSAFADGGVDLDGAVNQSYTLILDKGMEAYTSKTGGTAVTWPRTVGESGIDTIWVSQSLAGMTANPEEKTVSLRTQAKIKFYAPRLDFAEPAEINAEGRVTSWTHPVAGDPDSLDGDEYYHWVGSDVDLYVLIVNPVTNEICKECQMTLTMVDNSTGVTMTGDAIPLDSGAYVISIRSRKEYMDTTAYITISSVEDAKGLSLSSYVNLRFREPPVPYPQLVDLFDVHGESLGALNIPEPYYSQSKDYLDGKADSIAIHFHRIFQPNAAGEFKDSLPFLICLNWDEDVYEEFNYYEKGFSKSKKDTAVACSYTIDSVAIYNAFMDRYKANGNKSDSVITFVSDSTFSKAVKTAGAGKVLSFATFEDRKKITKQHFDRNVTDRMAPVIVSARVVPAGDEMNRLTITLSEPVKMIDETNKMSPFTFYLVSATEVGEGARFTSSTAKGVPTGLGSEKLTLLFDKTNPQKPTPRLSDFVRFRADSWMWSDTANIADSEAQRVASDSTMHWNSPTDYNSTGRLPSSWVTIVGEYSVDVSAVKFATMNQDNLKKPAVEVFIIPTSMNRDQIKALHPNTLGFIVKSDIASFMNSDSSLEACFNEKSLEDLKNVYFQYEVQYYTNLGSYVAGNKQKISCTDSLFNGNCRENPGNFYIAWNMLSDKKRLVGTGAYIARIKSFVHLGDLCEDSKHKKVGKVKASKVEETDMWGAKRGKGLVK